MSFDLQAFQSRLGHRFQTPQLLQQALTHRSFSADHNERLEFLGDAVLSLTVSALLYERLPDMPEGDLSRVRANLVKQDALATLATQLALAPGLRPPIHFGRRLGGRGRRGVSRRWVCRC